MYNGICQLPLSLAMLAIGFNFDNVEFCSIDDVSPILKAMGGTMIWFATMSIGMTFCDQDKIECTTDSMLVKLLKTDLITILTAIIQFALQIWASIVVFGSVSNWQSTNKSSDYFCEKTPFISLIVIWIIEWVWLGIIVFNLYRKYTNSNNVQIALIGNTSQNPTYSINED